MSGRAQRNKCHGVEYLRNSTPQSRTSHKCALIADVEGTLAARFAPFFVTNRSLFGHTSRVFAHFSGTSRTPLKASYSVLDSISKQREAPNINQNRGETPKSYNNELSLEARNTVTDARNALGTSAQKCPIWRHHVRAL